MIELIDTRDLFVTDKRDSFVHALSSWLEGAARRAWIASAYSSSQPALRAEMTVLTCIAFLHNRLARTAEAWNAVCNKDPGWSGKVQMVQPILGSRFENLRDWIDGITRHAAGVGNFAVDAHVSLLRNNMLGGPLGRAYERMFSVEDVSRAAHLRPSDAVELPGKMNFGNIDDGYRRTNRIESKLGISEKLPLSTIATRAEPDIDPALAAEIG